MFTVDTPMGPFSVIAGGSSVIASGFTTDPLALLKQVHPTLVNATGREKPEPIKEALAAYFAGDVEAIDDVAVEQQGGPFLSHAWKVLRDVREPITYTEFAERAGNPRAIRAAASACARNAAALFVPCHRVLRLDGSLGGYLWGLDVKRALLAHEAA
ncbi:MAG: methylated-DNA--[protein]-cysteine S-methyltransferase [Hamadaea sp.]|nr:methylated-DNA--[protein]-cysteine S-methyltransferase [Hamadaea sp.]